MYSKFFIFKIFIFLRIFKLIHLNWYSQAIYILLFFALNLIFVSGGIRVSPILFFRQGFSSSLAGCNVYFCNIVVRNRKNSATARGSPAQLFAPEIKNHNFIAYLIIFIFAYFSITLKCGNLSIFSATSAILGLLNETYPRVF